MFGAVALSLFLSWVQVSSDMFVVKSSAGEERARRVLRELEEFRQLIGTFLFRETKLPDLPIEVLVIGDDQTMQELAPEYNGRKVGVAAYYQRGEDRDFIVLSGRVFPDTLTRIVYHELTHYFLARSFVQSRPLWLSEGLAEYFATADIRDDEISLGGLSPERMLSLRSNFLLPLKDFFAVTSDSSYYNEFLKASVFYAQAWAFVHYMMHGEHAEDFRRYLDALATHDANLLDYLKMTERELESGFNAYLKVRLPRFTRIAVKTTPAQTVKARVESIPDSDARVSIAEVFLSNGQFDLARKHLEALGPELSRASYYRGVLARLAGDPSARDYFVDALLDRELAVRAAIQLVDLGDMYIPSVRTLLEEASASGNRNPRLASALKKLHGEDQKRNEEQVRLTQQSPAPPPLPANPTDQPVAAEPPRELYAHGGEQNIRYRLLSETAIAPRLQAFVPPYYPEELLGEKMSGQVVLDVQITEEGKVAGMWLVSAKPDVFEGLATAAVREWRFEPLAAKIRIILEFEGKN